MAKRNPREVPYKLRPVPHRDSIRLVEARGIEPLSCDIFQKSIYMFSPCSNSPVLTTRTRLKSPLVEIKVWASAYPTKTEDDPDFSTQQ